MLKFEPGDWVSLNTTRYFYVGRLTGEDDEAYDLAPGSSLVYETGNHEQFFGQGVADYCETLPVALSVFKEFVVSCSSWPHAEPPSNRPPTMPYARSLS